MEERKTIYLCLAHMSEDKLEQKYVQEAFDTDWVAPMGPNLNAFEKDIENYVNRRAYPPEAYPQPLPEEKGDKMALPSGDAKVVCLSSGTAALHLALLVCGVGPGDEVCVQSFTFCASSNPVTYLGAKPVFIDSEPDTWNMDSELLEKAILDRKAKTGKYPKAIVPVTLYGMPYDCERIMAIANKYDIPVVEDTAEGLGSRFNGQPLGTFGKFGVLSFNGNKMITTGGGGALICNGSLSPRPLLQRESQSAGRLQTADPILYDILKKYAEQNRIKPTEAESTLWEMLKDSNLGFKFRRRHPIADFIVDFHCPEKGLTIELDGGCHNDPNQKKADKLRKQLLEEMGYTEIRFSNEEVLHNTDNVLHIIRTLCKSLPSKRWQPVKSHLSEGKGWGEASSAIMWYATQARDAYPYYEHTAIGYNYRMSNVSAGIGRGQITVLDRHIAHHKHVQTLYGQLLEEVPGVHLHKQPLVVSDGSNGFKDVQKYDSNFWLCTATLDSDVKIQGQENAYKELIKTAVGGTAGIIRAVDSTTTDCQPNENVEALRVFMLAKKVECRPLWKPMHCQPIYRNGASLSFFSSPEGKEGLDCWEGPNMAAYTNGVSESIFKVGFCLPAGPYVSDEDVKYIVDCIKEAIV